jgi:anti-anti-sigma factor
MSELVTVEVQERGPVVVAAVSGELDLAGAPRTGEALDQAVPRAARGLVIDFTQLDFMDSSGVAMLFNLARRLGSRRQELRVVVPDGGPIARVLDIVEFERAAPVDGSLDDALAAMARERA